MSQITWVAVLDARGQRLAPCSTDKARQLLKQGKARPCRRWDIFAIQLRSKNVPTEEIGQSTIAVNPGAEYTCLAGFRQKPDGRRTPLLGLVLHHRGQTIRKRMEQGPNAAMPAGTGSATGNAATKTAKSTKAGWRPASSPAWTIP